MLVIEKIRKVSVEREINELFGNDGNPRVTGMRQRHGQSPVNDTGNEGEESEAVPRKLATRPGYNRAISLDVTDCAVASRFADSTRSLFSIPEFLSLCIDLGDPHQIPPQRQDSHRAQAAQPQLLATLAGVVCACFPLRSAVA